MTTRGRVAAIAGLGLLMFVPVVGCFIVAFVGPDEPWLDRDRQQAEFERNLRWPMVVGVAVFVAAVLLLVYAFVEWRLAQRSNRQ